MGTFWRSATFCFAAGLTLSIAACGGGGGGNTTPPPPTTYTLAVNSLNPATGVAIAVSPADANGASSGTTSFTRTYDSGASVTLTAPATAGGNNFSSWSGCASTNGGSCTVVMNGNAAVTANYTAVAPTTYTLTVNSANPASGVAITVAPADNNSAANGTTSFTRVYNSGASVTLTAPTTSGSNTFGSWTGCTSATTVTCTVVLSGNTTVTATYITPTPTYTLTVNSANPASGVAITVSPADNNSASNGTTSFARVYNSGATVTLTAPATSGGDNFSSWSGGCTSATTTCTVTLSGNTTVTANYVATGTYTLTVNSVNPSSGVVVAASPTDNNGATSAQTGTTGPAPTDNTLTYNAGTIVTLTAPATTGRNTFNVWGGCTTFSAETCSVTLNSNMTVAASYTVAPKITPTVTVTPSIFSLTTQQPLTVTVAVSGGTGNPTPTGSVVLTSGSYTSAAINLTNGSAQNIDIPAGSLAAGSDIIKATYSPDTASSTTYITTSGTSSAIAVTQQTAIVVSAPSTPLAVTDQIMGLNLAVWYDVVSNKTAIVDAFQTTGIKAVRWPGGSASEDYHWSTNTECQGGYTDANDTFANFVSDIALPAGLDLALTADYGTNAACTGGGDPAEAAAWVTAALTSGVKLSHVTVGNEEYGSWEEDLHSSQHNGATYAAAVVGSSGYYQSIKTAAAAFSGSNVMVGVDVDADNTANGWDHTVLANAKGSYDFVEYHYYPYNPGQEDDATLVHTAAQDLTTNLQTVNLELENAGTTGTPIYVGEMGSVSSNPGKQSWSITQGLYAGQLLGEMMNDGVSRATWWIGFGNCNTPPYAKNIPPNNSASLYGWQDFGAYNIFSDGTSDSNCPYGEAIGGLSPTAQAYLLFSKVAVDGEHVLTATVTGSDLDPTTNAPNVRAYAATNNTGTAVVVFNLNENVSEQVVITVPEPATASTVTVQTYDKATYDLSGSPTGFFPDPVGTSTWAPAYTTPVTSPTLPLTLTLTPWSMNVVMIH
jgi:hypothetical protein